MKAVILAGGTGTRLRPFTFSIPKPLLPIGKDPIIDIILRKLKCYGIKEAILSIGYHGEIIRAFCTDGSKYGFPINYFNEEKPLGTAGPISLMRDCFKVNEDFLLMNGDIITDLNFQELIDYHKTENNILTIAYKDFEYQSPFGVLDIENDRLSKIIEKPKTLYKISSGIYMLNASAIDIIPDDTYFTMPELINVLLKKGEKIGVFKIKEFWLGIEQMKDVGVAMEKLNKTKNC